MSWLHAPLAALRIEQSHSDSEARCANDERMSLLTFILFDA